MSSKPGGNSIDRGIAFEGRQSLRVSGLWIDESSAVRHARAQYQLVLDNVVLEEGWYLLEFAYRTVGLQHEDVWIVKMSRLSHSSFLYSRRRG